MALAPPRFQEAVALRDPFMLTIPENQRPFQSSHYLRVTTTPRSQIYS